MPNYGTMKKVAETEHRGILVQIFETIMGGTCPTCELEHEPTVENCETCGLKLQHPEVYLICFFGQEIAHLPRKGNKPPPDMVLEIAKRLVNRFHDEQTRKPADEPSDGSDGAGDADNTNEPADGQPPPAGAPKAPAKPPAPPRNLPAKGKPPSVPPPAGGAKTSSVPIDLGDRLLKAGWVAKAREIGREMKAARKRRP